MWDFGNFGCIKVFNEIHVTGDELLLYAVNIPVLNFGETSVIDINIASYVPLSAVTHFTKHVAVAPLPPVRLPECFEFCQPSSAKLRKIV